MGKQIIHTDQAPEAIGPYSQAVRAGDLLFVSGQIPLDPSTGQLVSGGIAEETARVMKNLTAIVTAAGANLDQVVKTTIFLADMGDFAAVNQVYAKSFTAEPPARACVEVSCLPKGVRVEIDAVISFA